jgi:hypothetical protein
MYISQNQEGGDCRVNYNEILQIGELRSAIHDVVLYINLISMFILTTIVLQF